jgi:cysteinyl-tRNA synthetase
MSKSLKNFITIDTLLQSWTARQVRLSFLTQLWNSRLDWNESLQAEVRAKETTFDVSILHLLEHNTNLEF